MTEMRDSQGLETLSATAALGLWADDVILALDRVTRLRQLEAVDKKLLNDAAGILNGALKWREKPLASPDRDVAETNAALDVAEAMSEGDSETDTETLLREISTTLGEVADGKVEADDVRLERVIEFFSVVGEEQLAKSNSVLSDRKDARAWTGLPLTSSFF
jgi:hypothetical protein